MHIDYSEVADIILKCGKCVALSGAGISAESGMPTFRSKGGLWNKYDPAAYLPVIAGQRGAKIIEINIERSFAAADIFIGDKAGKALPKLEKNIYNLIKY